MEVFFYTECVFFIKVVFMTYYPQNNCFYVICWLSLYNIDISLFKTHFAWDILWPYLPPRTLQYVIMSAMTSQITGIAIVCATVFFSGADQWKNQIFASLAFVTGGFPSQRASYAENVSIWWRHHDQLMITHSQLKFNENLFCNTNYNK